MFDNGFVFDEKYEIISKITKGGFGIIYKVKNIQNDKIYALKTPTEKDKNNKSINNEIDFYKYFSTIENHEMYIPKIKIINLTDDSKGILMKCMNMDLSKYIKTHTLSLKKKVFLSIKMLKIMYFIHQCGYIHRDVKLDNFILSDNGILCIDFGLSKKYIVNDKHIKKQKDSKCGTLRFMSINSHKFKTQSRRDDLESLAYSFIYMFKNNLPWQKYEKDKDKNKLILEMKQNIDCDELCNGIPKEYKIFLNYVQNLDFDEEPLYRSFLKSFIELYQSL